MHTSDVILISRTDVARHAGVGRAAVTNWESRYEDFPRPVRTGGRELFDAAAVAAWLDGRRIPANTLLEGEANGHDYGSRFRRGLGLSRTAPPASPAQPTSAGANAAQRLLDRLGGQVSSEHVIWLAFLVYVRDRHPRIWAELKTRSDHEDSWYLLEHAWRQSMHENPTVGAIQMPDGLSRSASNPSVRVRSLIALIDDAYHLLESKAPSTSHRPPSAELFVNLMEKYAQAQGRKSQEFFTPRAVVELAVDMVSPSSFTTRIYDPFCRAGEFLDEAVSRLANVPHDLAKTHVSGQHPNRALRSLAQMNLQLHRVAADIEGGNWWEGRAQNQRYDLIFANPPFNMRFREEILLAHDWRYGPPPAHNGNFAWLQYIVSHLGPGGRAAVIMPNNAGFSTNERERKIRAAMIEDGAVECVIALPSRLFAGTGISVSLWLLQEPSGTPPAVLFVNAADLGTSITRGIRMLTAEGVDRIVAVHAHWRRGEQVNEPGFARSVLLEEIRTDGHALNPAAYVEPSRSDTNPSAQRARVDELLQRSSLLAQRPRHLDDEVQRLWAVLDAPRRSKAASRTVPLGTLCVLKAGPSGSQLRANVQLGDGVPVILPKHLRTGYITDIGSEGVPEEIAQKLSGYRVKVDDLVIARTVEFGRVARINPEQQGWLFATGLIRLRTRAGILPSYLTHALASPASRAWMTRHSTGTVVPAITLTTLAKLPIPVPPLEEQEHISCALDAAMEQARVHADLASITQSLQDAMTAALFTRADK